MQIVLFAIEFFRNNRKRGNLRDNNLNLFLKESSLEPIGEDNRKEILDSVRVIQREVQSIKATQGDK